MSSPTDTDIIINGLRARIALPGQKAGRAVLILPSAAGIGKTVKNVMSDLTDAGVAALAWDPFAGYEPDMSQEQKSKIADTVQRDEVIVRQHMGCIDYLQHEFGTKQIATLGFCMGGRMSLYLAAMDTRIRAVAAFYPTLRDPRPDNMIDPVPLAGQISCPVFVHYPGRDHLTSAVSFQRLRAALEQRNGPAATVAFLHPHAGHGFMNQPHEGGGPDADASSVAWPPTLAFLKSALNPTNES